MSKERRKRIRRFENNKGEVIDLNSDDKRKGIKIKLSELTDPVGDIYREMSQILNKGAVRCVEIIDFVSAIK